MRLTLLVVGLLRRGIIDFDRRFRLQRAQGLVASGDDFIALLQTVGDLNVGDTADAGFDRAENSLLTVDDEDTLNLVLLGISARDRWSRGERYTAAAIALGSLLGLVQIL